MLVSRPVNLLECARLKAIDSSQTLTASHLVSSYLANLLSIVIAFDYSCLRRAIVGPFITISRG